MENRVRAGHGAEERGHIGTLSVEGWVGGGQGTVLCVGEDEVLSYEKVSKGERVQLIHVTRRD